jgi:hypothetical protein
MLREEEKMKTFCVRSISFFAVFVVIGIVSLAGCSSSGGGVSPLSAPKNLAAILGNLQVNLTWDAVSDATSYSVYWSTTAGVTKENAHYDNIYGAEYEDEGLTDGTTYYYRVATVNPTGVGDLSKEVSVTLPSQDSVQGAWISPTPQGNNLRSVWAVSADSVYAVGVMGSIIHYNGAEWEVMASQTTMDLNGVWGTSDTNMYAVGENGAILHWDGISWTLTSIGSSITDELHGIWGLDENNIYAGGNSGNVIHYNGEKWRALDTGILSDIEVVGFWGTDASNIYAYTNDTGIWRFDGSQWSKVYQPVYGGIRFTSMWGPSADNLYATSQDVMQQGGIPILFHYDGNSWAPVDSQPEEMLDSNHLNGVWGTSANDIYIVGDGSCIFRFDGTEWSLVIGNAVPELTSIHGTAGDSIFTVGEFGVIYGQEGTTGGDGSPILYGNDIFGYNDAEWKFMRSMVVSDFYDVWQAEDKNIYVCGQARIYHYNGADLEEMDVDPYKYMGFWGESENSLFVIGVDDAGSYLLRYDGNNWTPIIEGYEAIFRGIWGTSQTDLYIVADHGEIYHYNGNLEEMESPTNEHLLTIWGTGASNIYAIGQSGTLLHYDGASWSLVDVDTTEILWDIWGSSGNDIYIVGGTGTLLHYDGTSWTNIPTGTTTTLRGVWGGSGSDVYITGMENFVLHYNPEAGSMKRIYGPSQFGLNAITGIDENDFYAVGYLGTVVHYTK